VRTSRTVRLGIAGLGAAGRAILSAIEAHPGVELAAVCDPSAEARERVGATTQTRAVAEIEALLADPDLDAVYIATPTELHERHAVLAADAGKHVLVEKPMAVDLAGATRMIEAAERAAVVLLVGHSHSYDEPYRAIREIIARGELGRVRMMHSVYFSDWLYRPDGRKSSTRGSAAASRFGKEHISSTSCGSSAAGWCAPFARRRSTGIRSGARPGRTRRSSPSRTGSRRRRSTTATARFSRRSCAGGSVSSGNASACSGAGLLGAHSGCGAAARNRRRSARGRRSRSRPGSNRSSARSW
jgi:hypothetical protein